MQKRKNAHYKSPVENTARKVKQGFVSVVVSLTAQVHAAALVLHRGGNNPQKILVILDVLQIGMRMFLRVDHVAASKHGETTSLASDGRMLLTVRRRSCRRWRRVGVVCSRVDRARCPARGRSFRT